MKRKVILMGRKTHVVSLPATWVRHCNIEKGQEVLLQEKDNCLIINTKIKPVKKTITIKNHTIDNIIKAYQLGYDEIKVFTPATEALQTLVNTKLLGFEITVAKPSHCIFTSFSEINKKDFNNLFKRALLLLQSTDAYKQATALKLIYACKRALARKVYDSYTQSLTLHSLLCSLEVKKINNIEEIYTTFQKFEANKLYFNEAPFSALALC